MAIKKLADLDLIATIGRAGPSMLKSGLLPGDGLSLVLSGEAPAALAVVRGAAGSPVVLLRTGGLNRQILDGWGRRLNLPIAATVDSGSPPWRQPLARIPTQVISLDPRVEATARIYAQAVDAPIAVVGKRLRLEALIRRAPVAASVTLFLLHDLLDEELVHALWAANRARLKRGRRPLGLGIMTGLTPEHLGWLAAKTLVWLQRSATPGSMTLADFDGMRGELRLLVVDRDHCATEEACAIDPWTSAAVHAAAVYTHSVSFDAALGDTALCGHHDPPLPRERLETGPSCFFDGECFRIRRSDGRITRALKAVHATPLVWFLNGCGAIPLAGSAFGKSTGFALGLLSGAALGVIGPYLTQVSHAWRNRVFNALLATGATLGEIAAALSRLLPAESGFDSYLLLGSPDVRLCAPERLMPSGPAEGGWRYQPRGARRWAFRLALPEAVRGLPAVVADDGSPAWRDAACQGVDVLGRRELLLLIDPPRDVEGWIEVRQAGQGEAWLRDEGAELWRRLEVLKLYPFAQPERERIAACQVVIEQLRSVLDAATILRRRLYLAVLQGRLETLLDELSQVLAGCFLAEVTARDLNLDRESDNGFLPGLVRRTARRCPACGSALFSARDRWQADPIYRRRKDLCANCFVVSMALETSPLSVAPPSVVRVEPGPVLVLALRLRNRTRSWLRAWFAAAPRLGPASTTIGPLLVEMGPGSSRRRTLRFSLRGLPPGTLSFRFAIVARGSAEFHSCQFPGWQAPAGGAGQAPPSPGA
jgi:hypothetical protein